MKNEKNSNFKSTWEVLGNVLDVLKPLGPYVYSRSPYGSYYIRFKDPLLRTLRIGDHKGRRKYKFLWNIDFGGKTRTEIDRTTRYYFNENDLAVFYGKIMKKADFHKRLKG